MSFFVQKIGQCRFTTLQLLSLPRGFSTKFQSSITVIQHKDARKPNIPKVDELEVNWDDNNCKPMHKSVTKKLTIVTQNTI